MILTLPVQGPHSENYCGWGKQEEGVLLLTRKGSVKFHGGKAVWKKKRSRQKNRDNVQIGQNKGKSLTL